MNTLKKSLMLLTVLVPSTLYAAPKIKDRKPAVLASRSGLASWHDYTQERSRYYLKNGSMITASREFPCGTKLKVFNKANKKFVYVTVRDWGPARWTGRRLDLNKAAFKKIANTNSGQIRTTFYVVKMGKCRIHRH